MSDNHPVWSDLPISISTNTTARPASQKSIAVAFRLFAFESTGHAIREQTAPAKNPPDASAERPRDVSSRFDVSPGFM